MRIQKTFFNVKSNMFIYLFRTIMSFIVRTIFIKVLGAEILGLEGLYSNILYILSVAELGIGSAINYSLYKPISEKDTDKISRLMSLYRKIYKAIGLIVAAVGIIVILFLPIIVKNPPLNTNIYIVFIIFLFETVSSYFISYKETLILADQNNYELTGIFFATYFLMFAGQIISLLVFKNYYLYLIIKLIAMLMQKVICNIYITKKYKNIDFYTPKKINETDKNNIKTNVKGMFIYKVGSAIIDGTDNIIISTFINLSTVGVYNNYLSLTLMMHTMLTSIYRGVTSSFGNLITEGDVEVQENVFRKIDFFGYFIFGLVTVGYAILLNDFIVLWIGTDYIIPLHIVLFICVNLYLNGMKGSTDTIKEAAGLYNEDRYSSIIQAIVNIVFSIILVIRLGLLGVVLGTTISYILVPCWNRPYILYKHLFKRSPIKYYLNYIKNILILIIIGTIEYFLIKFIGLNGGIINFIINVIVVGTVYCILFVLFNFYSSDFKFFVETIKKNLKKEI